MPVIPVFDGNPLTSVIGLMHFPHELAKADALSKRLIASGPLQAYVAAGHLFGEESHANLSAVLAKHDGIVAEAKRSQRAGQAAGEVVKVLWALHCSQPDRANVSTALEYVEDTLFKVYNEEVGISTLRQYLKQMAPVLHFWGARSIRLDEHDGREWITDEAVGYNGVEDVIAFLTEAEILRTHLFERMAQQQDQHSYFKTDHYVMPEQWRSHLRDPRWPRTGGLPDLMISRDKLRARGKPGRPRKNPPPEVP